MADGQLAMNTAASSPGLFYKDAGGALVKVGPVHVGTSAPNASPASGGTAGNSVGEQWLDTTGGTYVFKVWDGSAWRSESGTFVDASGDTMTGALVMDNQQQVRFRETTANGTNYIALQAPASVASDKTITLPDQNGSVLVSGNASIVNADVNASAAIAGTKIAPDFGSQNRTSTGTSTAASFIPTSSTAPSNGVYLPASNSVAISTNGTGRLFVDASGNVGVGVASPVHPLDVAGNTAKLAGLTFTYQNNGSPFFASTISTPFNNSLLFQGAHLHAGYGVWLRGTSVNEVGLDSANNGLLFYSGSSERMRLDSSGRLGLGTSSPTSLLHLNAGASGGGAIFANQGYNFATVSQIVSSADTVLGGGVIASATGQQVAKTVADAGHFIRIQTGEGIAFHTNITGAVGASVARTTNERMRITSAGNVGIGTNGPSSLLHLAAASGTVHMQFNNGGTSSYIGHDSAYTGLDIAAGGGIRFRYYNGAAFAEAARFDTAGRLGIGTTSPTQALSVEGSVSLGDRSIAGTRYIGYTAGSNFGANSGYIAFVGGNGGISNDIRFNRYNASLIFTDGAVEHVRIDSAGRLLVGTSTARSNVFNSSIFSPIFQVESASSNVGRMTLQAYGDASTDGPVHIFAKHRSTSVGGNTIIQAGDECGRVSFQGSDGSEFVESAYISAAVDGTPGANDMPGRLVFSTTSDSASSPTERLRITSDAYVRLASGTGGIQFNGDTAAANALDDYEEGTWTPSYSSSNGDTVVLNYNLRTGKYVKIGQFVFVQFGIGANFTNVGTGSIRITGLPFSVSPTDNIPTIKSLVFSQTPGIWGATTPGQVATVGFASTLCLFDSSMTSTTQLTTAAFNTGQGGEGINRVHAALWYTV
jgi:hypothetical protein